MFTFSGAGSYSFSRSDEYKPDLILLSEPQIFQRDLGLLSKPFLRQYSFLLNSEENSNSDLALESSPARCTVKTNPKDWFYIFLTRTY